MKTLTVILALVALSVPSMTHAAGSNTQTLVLGGGCFWCTEAAFEMVPGVTGVVSGYAGGRVARPRYEDVITGETGHAETIRIEFDPAKVSLDTLLDFFWAVHDPTTRNRQGADVGTQYRSIILYADDAQKAAAEASRDRANPGWGGRIVTELVPLKEFYPAEDYHQDYYRKNPGDGYCRVVIKPKLDKLKSSPTVLGK